MGQEEMTRRCRMSGRRCRANRKRLTKIFTINKGDAIMKKRIVALVLACMLICSIAITASAGTYSGRYGDLLYAATTYCETNRCGAMMEGTPVNGANVADYNMYAEVKVYKEGSVDNSRPYTRFEESSTTGLLVANRQYSFGLDHIYAVYKINNYLVHDVTVYAN